MGGLHLELIFDILSRLPVKDLLRFKSVCKSWRQLIADPLFIKAQFNRSINNDSLSFLYTLNHHHLYLCSASNALTESTKIDLTFNGSPLSVVQIIGSCNGFICFDSYSYGIIVLNPSTRELIKLPELPGIWSSTYSIIWGFGFCSNTQLFKVVRIVYFSSKAKTQIMVHTVGIANGWRRVSQPPPVVVHQQKQVLVGGVPHWTAFGVTVVYFDVAREVFEKIPCPRNESGKAKIDSLGELRGCLCVFRRFYLEGHIEIWVMDEHGVEDSWNRKFIIPHSIIVYEGNMGCRPMWFLRNGKILVSNGERVVLYDQSRQSVRALKISGSEMVHIESLFSIKY
ncbi:hypothetical protein Sjap_002869 [Stephania japonica]|uniref:F-box domain-containing protein n=1 Tax=Stephania japonica TaxID=461633 RepID=A0AAP0KPE4_9MAGN